MLDQSRILQAQSVTQPLIFEGRVPVDYHQAYLLTGESDLMSLDFFAGQCNGLLGASVPGALILTTGTALGDVLMRLVVHEEEPPLDRKLSTLSNYVVA